MFLLIDGLLVYFCWPAALARIPTKRKIPSFDDQSADDGHCPLLDVGGAGSRLEGFDSAGFGRCALAFGRVISGQAKTCDSGVCLSTDCAADRDMLALLDKEMVQEISGLYY